ncbi:MAG: right-handed parallel beta-helix repeat-containing protein [Verrucomicrobia subdivision 3 bacterium]|nr:right-handed parallel beta-helix repeat-containing protein [Limisphaerales bacterium]
MNATKLIRRCLRNYLLAMAFSAAPFLACASEKTEFSPPPGEQQLPRAMHSKMAHRPVVTVGQHDAAIVGKDNRALQAAVDYVAALGGGVVEIGPGEYLMRDSLHLRSFVTVRGTPDKTILRKAKAATSSLALDGDYGEEQITLVNADGFRIGDGVAIWDTKSGGFHTTVARITGQSGNTFSIDKPLNADCMVANKAQAATVFPVVSGYHLEGARVEHLIIDGNKEENISLNGCRGAGIFLYRAFGTAIEHCVTRNYHGDGISFQQSNDVLVQDCTSEDNAGLGIHPGSGSQRPVVRACVARGNGEDGLFLCWRVRHGLFEKNLLENNGRFGISIGHKDTDNLLQHNTVRANHQDGVFFRNESVGMAGHRNRLEHNVIEDNGWKADAAGIRVRGETKDLLFKNNIIRDTRPAETRKQSVGIRIEESVGNVSLDNNQIDARTPVDDRRKSK